MQLTDAEIREILIAQKKKKRRKQKIRRMIALLVLILVIIAVIVIVKVHDGSSSSENSSSAAAAEAAPRGIIFLDPGHGGNDPGSDNGARREKDDTLRLANEVRAHLERANFKVYMSRTTDDNIDRTKRGEMANEFGAQLMICIHRNKASGGGDGVEGYIPLSDTPESRLLAENIVSALVEQGFTERSVRAGTLTSSEEDYEELAAAKMPACLIEVGFVSNDKDNKRFDENLDGNAKAMADAIEKTFHALYEPSEEAAEGNEEGSPEGSSESEAGN